MTHYTPRHQDAKRTVSQDTAARASLCPCIHQSWYGGIGCHRYYGRRCHRRPM